MPTRFGVTVTLVYEATSEEQALELAHADLANLESDESPYQGYRNMVAMEE